LRDLLLEAFLRRFHFIYAGKYAAKPVLTGIVAHLTLFESAAAIRNPDTRAGHNPVLSVGDPSAELTRDFRLAETRTRQS